MTTPHDRKHEERELRRRRIQRAAREVFAERGYAKTSIEQVSKQASLSVGAIYLYFRSKEDLYLSLLEETLEVFQTELAQIRAGGELRAADRLAAAWTFLTRWAATDVEASRVLRLVCHPGIREQLSDDVARRLAGGIGTVRSELAAVVQDGIAAGLYRSVDARATADTLWALLLGLLANEDGRVTLDLAATRFSEAAQAAFTLLESTLRQPAAGFAEAA